MQDTEEFEINKLHHIVLNELENDTIQEINLNFYRILSNFFGNLKKQEFDGVEEKIKDKIINITTDLTTLLINIRLDKILNFPDKSFKNLLNEEKFILDSEEEQIERTEIILLATINGKSKFLETISQNHKTKTIVLRFLQEVDEIVGVDLKKYGPFNKEDIATLPYENAQALISKNIATKIRWQD